MYALTLCLKLNQALEESLSPLTRAAIFEAPEATLNVGVQLLKAELGDVAAALRVVAARHSLAGTRNFGRGRRGCIHRIFLTA